MVKCMTTELITVKGVILFPSLKKHSSPKSLFTSASITFSCLNLLPFICYFGNWYFLQHRAYTQKKGSMRFHPVIWRFSATSPSSTKTSWHIALPVHRLTIFSHIARRHTYTNTHTHTHFQVQGLEKGVSENEAPGPVGAYTTTHNDTTILKQNHIHRTEIRTSRARIAEGVPAGCASLRHNRTHAPTGPRKARTYMRI